MPEAYLFYNHTGVHSKSSPNVFGGAWKLPGRNQKTGPRNKMVTCNWDYKLVSCSAHSFSFHFHCSNTIRTVTIQTQRNQHCRIKWLRKRILTDYLLHGPLPIATRTPKYLQRNHLAQTSHTCIRVHLWSPWRSVAEEIEQKEAETWYSELYELKRRSLSSCLLQIKNPVFCVYCGWNLNGMITV